MKKFVMMLLAVAMLFSGVKTVSAMSTNELVEKLEKAYVINGATFQITEETKVYLERYINNFGDTLTEDDINTISEKVDKVVEIVKASGATKVEDIKGEYKNQILDVFTEVINETSVSGTYVNGKIIIYEPGTTTVFYDGAALVKQTGVENNTVAIVIGLSAAVMLAGAFIIVRKVRAN